jgi:hypothetical protein
LATPFGPLPLDLRAEIPHRLPPGAYALDNLVLYLRAFHPMSH